MTLALLEGVPDHITGDFSSLGLDIILGEVASATSAESSLEITCPVRLAGDLEGFSAALRTTERDRLSH